MLWVGHGTQAVGGLRPSLKSTFTLPLGYIRLLFSRIMAILYSHHPSLVRFSHTPIWLSELPI